MMTSLLPTGSIRRSGRCLRIFSISTAGLVLLGSLIGVLGSLVLPSIASATTTVTLYASPKGSGSCTSSSSPCSLGAAIITAGSSTYSGDAVTVDLVDGSSGTCTASTCIFDGNFSVSGTSEASLTIEGSGTGSASSTASVLNGSNSGTTFYNSANFPVTLENLTVTGGNAGSGDYGGGIFNQGTMTVTDSTISGNSASDGGGILNNGGSTMTVVDSTISENSAGGGGGISAYGNMTVVDSTISGNNATYDDGGGILNSGGFFNSTITLAGSIVADQTSGGNCAGTTIIDAGYNLSNGTSCGFGTTSGSTSKDSVTNLDLSTTLANNGGPTETIAIPGSSAAAAFISSPATVTLGGISINLCSDTSYTTASGYKDN